MRCRVAFWWRQIAVHILREVEKFLKLNNTPATRFGRLVMGDPRFVFDLRRGREPRASTIQRVQSFLEDGQ
ncbi:MAG: hypothetical protein H0W65_11545 [Sphingomonas sp.]|nr:hypothetical protein [Sphingomonas sp.]MBA3668334.1 hypothetical protein [Sphingomonas sp.]